MTGRDIVFIAALWLGVTCTGAIAQTPIDCGAVPQSICEDKDLLALESERSALVQQLASADPQHAALAGEQSWTASLPACGEDVACYRTAYLNHNEALRQAAAALPGQAVAEPALEEPADAPTVEEQTRALDAVQEQRLRETQSEGVQSFVAREGPGWGFFTAIGLTLLCFWWLRRALADHRRETRAVEARLRASPR